MERIAKPRLIRKINEKIILNCIRNEAVVTKTRLFELTNISKQTINNIIKSLINRKLVIKIGFGESTNEGGKRPLLLKYNPDAYFLIGGMLGLKYIRFGITNLNGEIIIEKKIETKKESPPEIIINNIIKLIKDTIKESEVDFNRVLGIGIGVPGVVDFEKGLIEILPLFNNWYNIPLKDIIEKEFKIPVILDNENRMRAIGEKWFGLAKNVKNFITIITGDGIGACVVIGDNVIRGKNNICGEIGHMKLKLDGPLCACGAKGCFESLINTERFNEFLKENVNNHSYGESLLLDTYKKNGRVSHEEVFRYYNKKDKLAEKIVENIIYWFGIGISNLICCYDPELIILHGIYIELNDHFFNSLNNIIDQNIFPKIKKDIKIVKTEIGKEIGIIGAASIILDNYDL